MRNLARVAVAFLRRDLLATRPLGWVVEWMDVSLSVAVWYFVARFFGASELFSSGRRIDYFTFSLIGLALTQYVWRGYSAFSSRIQMEQGAGALEPLWLAPHPFPRLMALASVWDFSAATVNAVVILAVGKYGFGAPLTWSVILAVAGVGLVTSFAMGSLGLLSASWTIAVGRGNVLRHLLNRAIPILSGAFFPIGLFPAWLKAAAWCLPLTHALTLARGIAGHPEGAQGQAWAALLGLTVCLAAAGWASLRLALRCARVNGRLAAT